MARIESIAIGGYYPTPPSVIPRIARLLSVPAAEGACSALDPCAGDGAAVVGLLGELFTREQLRSGAVDLYAIEMEQTRYKALEGRRGNGDLTYGAHHSLHGDAFRATWSVKQTWGDKPGVGLLFLNPPYDTDPEHKRLEERFLHRFAPALCEGGVLLFLVPFYALAASATTLATHFEGLACFRFPEPDFGAYKQVVLVGKKRGALLTPDPTVAAQVEAWAADANVIPVLPDDGPPVADVPAHERYRTGFSEWRMASLDVAGILSRYEPVPVPPEGADLLVRRYPVAMPPKPAHIAAGIAAGVFNGARVEPDDAASGLPPLLVKGVFDKEFVTVEEKQNKQGEKTGELQVQQPKLVVTVLDLRARRYHTLKSGGEVTGTRDVAVMTTADLLACYGRSLTRVMLDQCPVLHDPARDAVDLPELPRKLYRAQAHAVMAAVKLLGGLKATRRERRGLSCFVLGEVGSGKSFCALATATTIAARRVLVLCPPHLLDSWRDQVAASVHSARVVVLREPADVDELAAATDPGMVVAILSRETAKLGHAWAGVEGVCPGCGAPVPDGDLAKKRARCPAVRREPANRAARQSLRLAEALMSTFPHAPEIRQLFTGRVASRLLARATPSTKLGARAHEFTLYLAARLAHTKGRDRIQALGLTLTHLVAAMPIVGAPLVRALEKAAERDTEKYGDGDELRSVAKRLAAIVDGSEGADWRLAQKDGALCWNSIPVGDAKHALVALRSLISRSTWREILCGEHLYQAIPEPRRYPLANYLARRHPRLLDLLVLDEGHEYAGDGSAQGFAAHRLVGLGIPTLMMTGSVMGGYAESLFANQWALDPEFRAEFSRDQRGEFVRRYGYLKQLVEVKDKDSGKAVAWGSVTDRVERSARTVGQAPGVLPLFVLRYLLRRAVTLHKSDLALDLPPCREEAALVDPGPELKARYERLQRALVQQIKEDRFAEGLAGKLWGQMAELPSYLDRATADTGNRDDGAYEIAYPEGVEGGGVVAREEPFAASTVLPKERWMIERVRAELAEGRRCLVFAWHAVVLPRLARLLTAELGEPVPVLDAGKVQAAKRQAWIDREVIAKKRRVLVVNPVAVQTGLNNLVWFSTEVWMQNPGCNAIVYRQATGRVDRIGQTQETRILFPVYDGTAQAVLHRLLLHKVGVSMSTDGLDAESALAAAGVGAQGFDGFAVGQLLYEILVGERRVPESNKPEARAPGSAGPPNEDLAGQTRTEDSAPAALVKPVKRPKPKQLSLF